MNDNQERIAYLQKTLPEGSRIYTVLRHVSQSGMLRRISLVAVIDEEIRSLDYSAAKLLGKTIKGNDGIPIKGGGRDMGFALVCDLSYEVHGKEDAWRQQWL